MYDERTRYIQANLGYLATVEKEKKDARIECRAEGIEEGIEKGKAHGIKHRKKMMIISLIINVNLKMYKSGNLKMYNFTH